MYRHQEAQENFRLKVTLVPIRPKTRKTIPEKSDPVKGRTLFSQKTRKPSTILLRTGFIPCLSLCYEATVTSVSFVLLNIILSQNKLSFQGNASVQIKFRSYCPPACKSNRLGQHAVQLLCFIPLKVLIKPLVDESCDCTNLLSLSSGSISLASCFPSSTPH